MVRFQYRTVVIFGSSLLVASAAIVACNGTTVGTGPGAGDVAPTGPAVDAAASLPSTTLDAGDGGATVGVVIVSVSQETSKIVVPDGGTDVGEVRASLERYDYADARPVLSRVKEDACTSSTRAFVEPREAGASASPPFQWPQPGYAKAMVRGGALPPEGVALFPESDEMPHSVTFPGKGWSAGEYLTFEATEGRLPAMAGKDVQAPSPITLQALSLGPNDELSVDRTGDLKLTWTGGGAGQVEVFISARDTNTRRSTHVVCGFPANDGRGLVAAKVLASLPRAGDPGVTGTYSIAPANWLDFVSRDLDVSLGVVAAPTKSGKMIVSR